MVENAVSRDIPNSVNGKKLIPFKGAFKHIPKDIKVSKKITGFASPDKKNKAVKGIDQSLSKIGLSDGMTISFHHHFRNGDFLMNMILENALKKDVKNLTLAPSSTFPCQEEILLKAIKNDTVTYVEGGSFRNYLGKSVSKGLFDRVVRIRSHGGRARAIVSGDFNIDIDCIGASSSDFTGNCNGLFGPSACGCIQYSVPSSEYAEKTLVVTDNLVEYPCIPNEICEQNVDVVSVVDKIGNPAKIVSGTLKITEKSERLKIAKDAVRLSYEAGYIHDGCSFQAGAGGISLAFTKFLGELLEKKDLIASWAMGGTTSHLVDILKKKRVKKILTGQTFDLASINSLQEDRNHQPMGIRQYANIFGKGCAVNNLDMVVLGATEIDTDFNVNTVTYSNGQIAQPIGGHQDTAAGAKLTIVTVPLSRKNNPIIVDEVTTVTTPGETIDAVVTEKGIAVNPRRDDLIEKLKNKDLSLFDITKLKDIAYRKAGVKQKIQPEWGDRLVALVEYRDGTVIDIIRNIKN